MKICIVATSMKRGGVQSVVRDLADGLVERGHQVRIVSIFGQDEVATSAGVERRAVSGKPGFIRPLWAAIVCSYHILRYRPDVVNSHAVHANLVVGTLAFIARRPRYVRTLHSVNEGGRIHAWLMRRTRRFTDVHVAVSEAVRRAHCESGAVASADVVVVRNGVDVERFSYSAQARERYRAELAVGADVSVLVNVGRLTPAKDHRLLLSAFGQVRRERAGGLVLWLVGDGELRPEVEQWIADEGLEGAVRLLGARSDIPELLSAADLFVMSSAWEGYPVCILEACASGLPVVATDVGGVGEAIGVTGSGTLVSHGSAPELAHGIAMALETEQRGALREQSAVSDGISTSEMVETWEGVLEFQ